MQALPDSKAVPSVISEPRKKIARSRVPGLLIKELVYIVVTAGALLPVYFIVITAFKSDKVYQTHPFGLPADWTLSNFSQAFDAGFLRWLWNTVAVDGLSVLLTTFLASLAAFAFAWLFARPPKVVTSVIAVLMMVPPIVMLIPLYQMASWANQVNTYQAVVIIYSGLMMPFSTYMLTSFFRTIPRESVEAALMDGASLLKIYRSIVMPLSLPALLTLAVVNLLWAWNELLIALTFLQSDTTRTLMAGISMFQSKSNLNVPVTMAGLLIATVPIVVLYL
ncbi:MAG: carbohydrate ABC transporter permease, partial [Alicyclobacillus sp.]|nr:carbohydrate ABC transporter permease [Alicyclobacillus sp.]